MIRWSYLIRRVVILAIFWCLITFGLDPFLHWSFETAGGYWPGAKLDIATVDANLMQPKLQMESIQYLEMKGDHEPEPFITVDKFRCGLETGPLLKKKFIIDKAELHGLNWNGRIPGGQDDSSEMEWQQLPLVNTLIKLVADAIEQTIDQTAQQLDPNKLATVKTADRMQSEWEQRFQNLQARLNNSKTRINQLKDIIDGKGLSTAEKLKKYPLALREMETLLKDLQRIRSELNRLPQLAQRDLQQLDTAKEQDLQAVKSMKKLFSFQGDEIAEKLLGPRLAKQSQQVIRWIQTAREISQNMQESYEPERYRGVDFAFNMNKDIPQFLLRELVITGSARIAGTKIPFQGTVTGITSDPALHGEPVLLNLKSSGVMPLEISSVMDYRQSEPVHQVYAAFTDTNQARYTANIRHREQQISGRLAVAQADLSSQDLQQLVNQQVNQKPEIQNLVNRVLSGVKGIDAELLLAGHVNNPQWKLKTNLGTTLSEQAVAVLSDEISQYQQKTTTAIRNIADDKAKLLTKRLNEQFSHVMTTLNMNETQAKQALQQAVGGRLNLGKFLPR